MQKVVSISQGTIRLEERRRAAREENNHEETGREYAAKCMARRGTVVEFPRLSQGPLFAATVTVLAIAGMIGSAALV